MTLREYVEASIKNITEVDLPKIEGDLQANHGALQAFKNMLREIDRVEAESAPPASNDGN